MGGGRTALERLSAHTHSNSSVFSRAGHAPASALPAAQRHREQMATLFVLHELIPCSPSKDKAFKSFPTNPSARLNTSRSAVPGLKVTGHEDVTIPCERNSNRLHGSWWRSTLCPRWASLGCFLRNAMLK